MAGERKRQKTNKEAIIYLRFIIYIYESTTHIGLRQSSVSIIGYLVVVTTLKDLWITKEQQPNPQGQEQLRRWLPCEQHHPLTTLMPPLSVVQWSIQQPQSTKKTWTTSRCGIWTSALKWSLPKSSWKLHREPLSETPWRYEKPRPPRL